MHSLPEQVETLGLMAAHESAIAELYEEYAATFAEHTTFFRELAAEEKELARLIVSFADDVKRHVVQVDSNRFSSVCIFESLDNVRRRLKEAQSRQDLSLVNALSVCADLENTMIERRYFDAIQGDGPELAGSSGVGDRQRGSSRQGAASSGKSAGGRRPGLSMSTHSRPRGTRTAKPPLVLAYRGTPRPRWGAATHETATATEPMLRAYDRWPQGVLLAHQTALQIRSLVARRENQPQARADGTRCKSRDSGNVNLTHPDLPRNR